MDDEEDEIDELDDSHEKNIPLDADKPTSHKVDEFSGIQIAENSENEKKEGESDKYSDDFGEDYNDDFDF